MRDSDIQVDDRVYQTEGGKMYIDTDEFIRSEAGQRLLEEWQEVFSDDSNQDA